MAKLLLLVSGLCLGGTLPAGALYVAAALRHGGSEVTRSAVLRLVVSAVGLLVVVALLGAVVSLVGEPLSGPENDWLAIGIIAGLVLGLAGFFLGLRRIPTAAAPTREPESQGTP